MFLFCGARLALDSRSVAIADAGPSGLKTIFVVGALW